MKTSPLLSTERLSLGYEDRTILKHVSLEVPRSASVALMGPSGVGKSSLLRTFGRFGEMRPSFWVHGRVLLGDRDLLEDVPLEEAQRRIVLFQQKARLFTASVLDNALAAFTTTEGLTRKRKLELAHQVLGPFGLYDELAPRFSDPVTTLGIGVQRKLLLARLLTPEVECVLLDEPLRDLGDAEKEDLTRLLHSVRERVALVFVTHNLLEARALATSVVLLADGTMIEQTDASEFFTGSPRTELGLRFRTTGNCWTAAPLLDEATPPVALDDEPKVARTNYDEPRPSISSPSEREQRVPSWRPSPIEAAPRPGGFHWILRDRLGGMQMPGLLREEESDLRGAAALGIRHMITLTENPFPSDAARRHGIETRHFPIDDMGVPTFERAYELATWVLERVERGEPVVLHCRAGLGRTGTMLACVLVRSGKLGPAAIETVRKVNPLYIQSEAQLNFVGNFSDYCASRKDCA